MDEATQRLRATDEPSWLDSIVEIAAEHADDGIERMLRLIRSQLDLDVAVLSELRPGEGFPLFVEGDGALLNVSLGHPYELAGTWCQAVLDGRLPNVIPDTSAERVRAEAAREPGDPRTYIGVPVRFSTGRLYGVLCAGSSPPHPGLRDEHLKLMRVVARLIAEELEREELERQAREAGSVRAFLVALAARDPYTGEHSAEVVDLAAAVARRLELPEREVAVIRDVALLHDIGKIALPDSVLKKPAPLAEWEWKLVQQHPVVGADMVAAVKSTEHLAPAVRAEHERWDGAGYPDGLAGAAIPIASRVILACDAYHAMISDRPYRRALGDDHARGELTIAAGSQFDPKVVDALLEVLSNGALVRHHERIPFHTELPPCNPVLTPRQREILSFVAAGFTHGQIAAELFISTETARTHVRNAIERLGARSRSHAVALAIRRGELLDDGLR